jgi:hypothetical protein
MHRPDSGSGTSRTTRCRCRHRPAIPIDPRNPHYGTGLLARRRIRLPRSRQSVARYIYRPSVRPERLKISMSCSSREFNRCTSPGRHCPQSVYERPVPHWPITFNDGVQDATSFPSVSYRFFKSTGRVSETIAHSENRTRSASNLGIDASPQPRQPQRWQRCGRMIVKVLRNDSHQCRV